MTSSLQQLIDTLQQAPSTVTFDHVQAIIAEHYVYQPTRFTNGKGDDCVINDAGTNEGSCKIFAFAQLHQLSNEQTLACFGHFYREHVLGNPDGSDHANIRTFMRHGMDGIHFEAEALRAEHK